MTALSAFIIALGAVLAALIARYASFSTARIAREAAEKSAEISRAANENSARIQLSIRVAEFRQNWIDSLRNNLSELHSLCADENKKNENAQQMLHKLSLIELHFKPDDPEHKDLRSAMNKLLENIDSEPDIKGDASNEVMRLSREILKKEWERLKQDLRETKI